VSPRGGDTVGSHKVLVCTTGKGPKDDGSELEKAVRITKKGQRPEVVMRLGPGRRSLTSLPDLAPGDLLRVSAEVEVTTDSSPPYYGKAYESFSPMVRASLLLASGKGATEPDRERALRLCPPEEQRCTHQAHHSMIVFTNAQFRIPEGGLPWSGDSFVNLVLDAHHPNASDGQLLLIGEHEHIGDKIEVKGGKGRLNAIRIRPAGNPPAKTVRSNDPLAKHVPVDKEKRTVAYSVPLNDLAKGEQIFVSAAMSTDHPGYPARISTRLLLGDDKGQTDTGGRAKDLAEFKGEIGDHNGFNGKGGRFRTRRVGVLRVEKPASRACVNLVADSGDPLRKGKPGDKLGVIDDGFVEVVRYPPKLKG
jgi:hypothetical protein